MDKYDFSGWATRNDLKCSDGRTIRKDAFKHCDGKIVPLVYMHQHNNPEFVLGHALLENREQGVYAYCSFNDTDMASVVKEQVKHGDITALSIYANQLQQQNGNVFHGSIREVSLVLAGANPGAYIDSVICHGDGPDDVTEFVMSTVTDDNLKMYHAEEPVEQEENISKGEETMPNKEEQLQHSEERTVQDVFNEMTEEQKTVVYALIGEAIEQYQNGKTKGDDEEVKQNAFEQDNVNNENVLSHADMEAIISDAKRYGSLKDAFLAHGIENIDYLFPEAHNLNPTPEFIKRDTGWVGKVMSKVHHTPFSRIKSQFANITEDDARAKGYIKGNLKKEEVFSLLKRTTTPTTVYKKQKLDRDDIVDIKDFDVIAWLKAEMRMMLDEELARAYLLGDGRLASSDDKINEGNIRPIYNDHDLYTVKTVVAVKADASADIRAKAFIRSVIKNRKFYKGTGNPDLWTTEDMISDMLLIEDANGRVIYDSIDKLKNVLRVNDIIPVPVMEGYKGVNGGDLAGILVNLVDYNVGADKGGAVNMFDDFDIDYNAQKYLIETRCSGALTKPYAAIAFEFGTATENN